MNPALLFILFIVPYITVSAQTADYFTPAKSKKLATFFMPSKTNNTMTVRYDAKGNSVVVTDSKLVDGVVRSKDVTTYLMTDEVVTMTSTSRTGATGSEEVKEYNPAEVVFKMPPKEGSVEWSYHSFWGDLVECTAFRKSVKVDGKEYPAVILRKAVEDGIGVNVEYYVKGMGLWHVEFEHRDGSREVSYKRESLE